MEEFSGNSGCKFKREGSVVFKRSPHSDYNKRLEASYNKIVSDKNRFYKVPSCDLHKMEDTFVLEMEYVRGQSAVDFLVDNPGDGVVWLTDKIKSAIKDNCSQHVNFPASIIIEKISGLNLSNELKKRISVLF